MGISGLLTLLKDIQVHCHIKEFKGKRWVEMKTARCHRWLNSLAVDVRSGYLSAFAPERLWSRGPVENADGHIRHMSGCIKGRLDVQWIWSRERRRQSELIFDQHQTTKLCSSGASQTDVGRFVDYAMHRVRLLRYYGITPFIVFDGGPLPAKKGTEASRAK